MAAGGDLCSAIERDADGELKWHRDGHHIALDIAKGLYFLHSHDVRLYLDTTNFPIHQYIRMLLDFAVPPAELTSSASSCCWACLQELRSAIGAG